jgi:hypothetical protein
MIIKLLFRMHLSSPRKLPILVDVNSAQKLH